MAAKVATVTPKTSRMRTSINPHESSPEFAFADREPTKSARVSRKPTKSARVDRPPPKAAGFTLIEVMVVLGILAALLAIGLPRMNINNTNIKNVVRQMSVVTREIRNQARLKNRTYRLALNMDPKGSSYWIESADGPVYAPSEETLKRLAEGPPEQAPPSKFQKDQKILKKDRELPQPLHFGLLDLGRTAEPQKTGTAYIYFSPEGLVEKAAIQITNGQALTWTLIINPLTGHADIVEKATLLKDVTR